MLSLRDSGKIQQDNASILNLGALCGFKPSFSLKDFILKDCLVTTQPFRIGVALISGVPRLRVSRKRLLRLMIKVGTKTFF